MKSTLRLAFYYAKNTAEHLAPKSKTAEILIEWSSRLNEGFDIDEAVDVSLVSMECRRLKTDVSLEWRRFLDFLDAASTEITICPPHLFRNAELLAGSFDCSPVEIKIFKLALSISSDPETESLFNLLIDDSRLTRIDVASLFIKESRASVERALKFNARLVNIGLIERNRIRGSDVDLTVPDRLLLALDEPQCDTARICESLFGKPVSTNLNLADFDHLPEERDLAVRILKGALESQAEGVNVLLYGPPGSGKTALCALIAKTLKAQLRLIGSADEDGDEPSRTDRLREYRLAQSLLCPNERNIVLFDELEDLTRSMGFGNLGHFNHSSGSKLFMNRLLEANTIPTLWTTNDLDEVDPALLRRMTMAFEVPKPPQSAQRKIWLTATKAAGLRLPKIAIDKLSADIDAPPGLIATAAMGAKLAGGGIDELRTLLKASTRIQEIKQPEPTDRGKPPIDLSLFNADIDLAVLTERLASCGADPVSFCLHGAPGTGKSEYVRFLAKKMGIPVIQKRASDLLGMYVGQSEKQIAAAFRAAKREGAFLIFDEADSLLRSRIGAQRRWEVSQVNEMLTWMEQHSLPFACTTNLLDTLDPASARRFTFKVGFRPLDGIQQNQAFRLYFKADPPERLMQVSGLTPGDFAVVRKKARMLTIADPDQLVSMLKDEQSYRDEKPTEIGFAISGQRS